MRCPPCTDHSHVSRNGDIAAEFPRRRVRGSQRGALYEFAVSRELVDVDHTFAEGMVRAYEQNSVLESHGADSPELVDSDVRPRKFLDISPHAVDTPEDVQERVAGNHRHAVSESDRAAEAVLTG